MRQRVAIPTGLRPSLFLPDGFAPPYARFALAATLPRGRFFVFRNLRPPEAQLFAPKRRTASKIVGTSLHASLSRRFQMVFSALALNASAAAPKVRQTSKSARRPSSSVSAKPAFAARPRADVGVARMSGSRRVASRMVIAAAGGEVSVGPLATLDRRKRRQSSCRSIHPPQGLGHIREATRRAIPTSADASSRLPPSPLLSG